MSAQNDDNASSEEVENTVDTSVSRPINPLSRPTDAIARPGFRNPANKKTKAQKKRRRKKK